MKKFLCIFLVILLVVPYAFADGIDYSNMTDEELKLNLTRIRYELNKRIVFANKNEFLYNGSDIEIYFTGKGKTQSSYDGSNSFLLGVVFVNKTNQTLGIQFDSISINGWEVDNYTQFSKTGAGKKIKEEIELVYSEADLDSYKDMQEIEVSFHTFDENFRRVKDYGPIMFNFNGKAWN